MNEKNLLSKRHEDIDIKTAIAAFDSKMMKYQKTSEHFRSIGDTYFDITWIDFIEIAKAYGFKNGYCQKFTGSSWSDKGVEEEEIIFFLEEKGLILYAESFEGNSVNCANVYGEVKIGDALTLTQLEVLTNCSYKDNGNGTMYFDVDVREALHFQLDALSEAFEFSKSWTKVPFLWFLNYMDTKGENYNYKRINKQKIEASTPEVRKIIFG